jgi:hypothetical protein
MAAKDTESANHCVSPWGHAAPAKCKVTLRTYDAMASAPLLNSGLGLGALAHIAKTKVTAKLG